MTRVGGWAGLSFEGPPLGPLAGLFELLGRQLAGDGPRGWPSLSLTHTPKPGWVQLVGIKSDATARHPKLVGML